MIETKSESILKSFRNMSEFFEDIALMLRTSTDHLKHLGWTPKNHQAVTERGESVNVPEKWAPSFMFRFLECSERPYSLCFISVILDDLDKPHEFHTPLVSVGMADYTPGCEINSTYEYVDSKSALWAEERCFDYKTKMEITSEALRSNKSGAEKIVVVAGPLTSIKSIDDLERMVIQPLSEIIQSK